RPRSRTKKTSTPSAVLAKPRNPRRSPQSVKWVKVNDRPSTVVERPAFQRRAGLTSAWQTPGKVSLKKFRQVKKCNRLHHMDKTGHFYNISNPCKQRVL